MDVWYWFLDNQNIVRLAGLVAPPRQNSEKELADRSPNWTRNPLSPARPCHHHLTNPDDYS